MLGKYKKSHLIINVILFILMAFMFLNVFYLRYTSYWFLITTILIPTVLIILIFGYEKKNRRFKYELTFFVFAYSSLFLVITYLIGLSIGYTASVYKLNFSNFIHNIIPYFLLIVSSEVLRYEISRKGDGSFLSYVLITIILIFVDLSLFVTTYDLNTSDGYLKYVCGIFLPSLFKNVALLYFTKRGGLLPSLVYRIMLDLKLVVLPIFPDFGIYFESIIYTMLPMIMLFLIQFQLKPYIVEDDSNSSRKTILIKYIIFFILLAMVLFVNILVSSVFKYGVSAIGSGSMTPNINKGDAVIFEKLDKKEEPVIGDILVFKKEKRVIVHRIIEIVKIGEEERIYYTKGDANEKPDGYPIERKDIVGVVKSRIRYIGIPSVALSEIFNK